MRVFLDTNVLVSAVATRGLCADVLRDVLSCHDLLVSEYLLAELGRVLTEKIGATPQIAEEFQQLLRQDTALVASPSSPNLGLRDKTDEPIVGAALEGGADILVTGDKELLNIGRTGRLRILSPRQFWEELRSQSGGATDEQRPCTNQRQGS